MPKQILKFPVGFLWGVSTSAYQIEGGITNDWSQWERSAVRTKELKAEGKNPDDFICGRACDSYNRYEEDFSLAEKLNCGAYRLGVEWARLEPVKGCFNQAEIEYYKKILQVAKKRNLKIILTLWHWTSPVWLMAEGGWANKKAVEYFSRYVKLIADELGEFVDYWVTINEPMVYVANGYLTGKFPPNKKNAWQALKDYNNLIKAHRSSYEIIHEKFPRAKVGLTMLTNFFEPARKGHPLEIVFAKLANHCWNNRFVKKLKNEFDFLGLDYYFHDRIIWRPPFIKNENKKITDMGWEIYPVGIYRVLKNYKKFNKPLFIMENGLADAHDDQRAEFIVNHLKYVHQAIGEGINVQGYFYWSLIDNFEWARGYGPKFGLYAVDRKT
ncbi:glycoside hydrolase family 1 protein, partial [Candidatus Falkowbacteria bacterium]|nr:glycoside hydrolase family 1 protein [Candidatus Falkowbacteria bacterium]